MLVEVDEAETCADDALDVHVSVAATVVPLADGAALVAADEAGELVDVAELDVAAAELVAAAEADDAGDANADAEGLLTGDPNAAAEPLAPGVAPVGPQATAMKRAAMAVDAMTILLMTRCRAHHVPPVVARS